MKWTRGVVQRFRGTRRRDFDQRFEALASRIEQHTVNLAEHQAQLRDESIRQIVNEVRANSAFLADSTIAMERINERRTELAHAAVRPMVHTVRDRLPSVTSAIVVELIDPVLVDELVTDGIGVTVLRPAVDYVLPAGVVVSMASVARFRHPSDPVPLVVWVSRAAPSADDLAAVRGWMRSDGACVIACRDAVAVGAGFRVAETRAYRRTETGMFARVNAGDAGHGDVDLSVHHLVAT